VLRLALLRLEPRDDGLPLIEDRQLEREAGAEDARAVASWWASTPTSSGRRGACRAQPDGPGQQLALCGRRRRRGVA